MRRWRPKARQAPALPLLTSFVIKRQQIHTPAPARAGDSALIMFTAETYCCVRSRRSRHGPPGTFPRTKGSGSSIIEAYLWKGSGEQRELKPAAEKKNSAGLRSASLRRAEIYTSASPRDLPLPALGF